MTSSVPYLDNDVLQAHLFEAIRLSIIDAGGDGDGWVVSQHYTELADLFERYETEHGKWFPIRSNREGMIEFIHEQESICFVSDRSLLPNYAGDIIVEI